MTTTVNKTESKLAPGIFYEEYKKLFPEDKKVQLTSALLKLKSVPVSIVIGKQQFTFLDNNIIYFPIYLTHNNAFVRRIGVYEFNAEQLYDIVDSETDEYNLKYFKSPLLFSFVNKEYLSKYTVEEESDEDEDDSAADEESEKSVKDDEDDIEIVDSDSGEEEDDDDKEGDDGDEDDEESVKEYEDDEESDEESLKDDADDEESGSEEDIIERPSIDPSVLDSRIAELSEFDIEDPNQETMTEYILNQIPKQDEIHNEYKSLIRHIPRSQVDWMKKLTQNINYNIIDNEGGGDCFFAVLRDAFNYLGKKVTVRELREIFAREITQEMFNQYKGMYETTAAANEEQKLTESQFKVLDTEMKEIRSKLRSSTSRGEKAVLKAALEEKRALYNSLVEYYNSMVGMSSEYDFMATIDSVEEMRKAVTECSFWADTIVVSTLERVLNTKFIILSREQYQDYARYKKTIRRRDETNMEKMEELNKYYKRIFQCGTLNDTILEERGIFQPKYYIILDYSGDHYQLITYGEKGIFTFEELPFEIKKGIANACIRLERPVGPYAIIPKFLVFKYAVSGLEM